LNIHSLMEYFQDVLNLGEHSFILVFRKWPNKPLDPLCPFFDHTSIQIIEKMWIACCTAKPSSISIPDKQVLEALASSFQLVRLSLRPEHSTRCSGCPFPSKLPSSVPLTSPSQLTLACRLTNQRPLFLLTPIF